jgi:hypothetical protein
MKRIGFALALLGSLIGSANAQSIQKYFGYFSGDTPPSENTSPSPALVEFKGHINLYSIGFWSEDESASGRGASKEYLLRALANAKAAHVHAIIPAFPFVFQVSPDFPFQSNQPCYSNDTGAAEAWADLVQSLVSSGYLIPGNPDKSVVSAIYVVDEPNHDGVCLADTNGVANPALVNAVNVIRGNPSTSAVPLASVMSVEDNGFDGISKGLQLFDWVGFDKYTDNDAQWSSDLSRLKQAAPGKKYIIVPGAQTGNGCVGVNNTTRFFNAMDTDPSIVWLAPFVWFSDSQCQGIRDIPSVRPAYTSEGAKIKAQGCASSKDAANYCKPVSIEPVVNLIMTD